MEAAEGLARLLLALLLLLAAVTKAADPGGTRAAITGFGVPELFAPGLAVAVPVVEAALGLLLPWSATARPAALGAAALLGCFAVVMAGNVLAGRAPDCHCFGAIHSKPVSWRTVTFTVGLAVLAGYLASVPAAPLPFSTPPWFLASATMLALACTGGGWMAVQLMQQQGRILVRLDALEARLGMPAAASSAAAVVRQGMRAPDFELDTQEGEVVTLRALLRNRLPLLLLFVDPNCGPCSALLPDVARWRAALPSILFVLISRPGTGSLDAAHAGSGIVLLQRDRETATAYGCHGTPGAVLVQVDGTLASPLVMGADNIRAMITPWLGQASDRAARPAPALGDPVPELILPDPAGRMRSLGEFRGRTVLALFWNPSCGFCTAMLPRLAELPLAEPDGLVLLIVTSTPFTPPDGVAAIVLWATDFSAAGRFGAAGTPSAVLIAPDGRIGSEVLAGEAAIFRALRTGRSPSGGTMNPAFSDPLTYPELTRRESGEAALSSR